MILQGKGGVGKSMIAAMLAQYKLNQKQQILCIDSDPVNPTFAGYEAFNVQKLKIIDKDKINPLAFDYLVEMIAQNNIETIIDNGASSFIELSNYMVGNNIAGTLLSLQHQLVIHTVITGGQAFVDTVNSYTEIIKRFPSNTLIIVWLNPFWGVVNEGHNNFYELSSYLDYKDRLAAVIEFPNLTPDTFGRDFNAMLEARKTFVECEQSPALMIMARQRLKQTKDMIFAQMDKVAVLQPPKALETV